MEIKQLANLLGINASRITKDGDKAFTISGDLYLRSLTSLPEGVSLTAGGSLDLRSLTSLPEGVSLTAGGYLYLKNNSMNIAKPGADFRVKLRASIELGFNLRGFTIADSILARLVSKRGAVRKVIIVGRKEVSYLVTDDKGNHAHGATLKEARESLVYKNVAQFDGKVPKKATGKEWVGIYRAVTGACASGVRHFVEQQGRSLDDTYTLAEITTLTKGRFGHEQFVKRAKA